MSAGRQQVTPQLPGPLGVFPQGHHRPGWGRALQPARLRNMGWLRLRLCFVGLEQALVSDDVGSEDRGKGGLGAEAEEWTSGQARGQTRPGLRERKPVGVLAAEVTGARSPRPLPGRSSNAWAGHSTLLTSGETKAQRGKENCPRTPSKQVTKEPGL